MQDGIQSANLRLLGSIISNIGSFADIQLGDGTVGEAEIASSAVVAAKIGSGAVTQAKLGSNVVGAANIANSGIGVGQLAANAVTSAAIAANTITAADIAADAIGTSEQGIVGIGSPPAYVSRILHGSTAIPAATSVWVIFGDTFGAAPDVVTGTGTAGDVDIFSVNPGSFLASGTNTTVFWWMAAGST